MALGVISCKKEDYRLSEGYFEIRAESPIEVVNHYLNGTGEVILFKGDTHKVGYLVSDYVKVRCLVQPCLYIVNYKTYTSSSTFYPPKN